MATNLSGIADYVKRLEQIAQDNGEKTIEAVQKDEFLRLKSRCYDLLESSRSSIQERQAILQRKGNCYETIQKGNTIRQQLDELKKTIPRLHELHKRASKKWGANKRKDELAERYQVMRVLTKHFNEANELYLSGNPIGDQMDDDQFIGRGPNASLLGLRNAASSEDSHRNMNDDEQGAVDKIRAKDAEIDTHIDELGQVAGRLTDLGKQIGVSAERQRMRAEGLNEDVDKCEQDIRAMNKKTKEIIEYQKNTNFCCQFILCITLFICAGFILNQVQPIG